MICPLCSRDIRDESANRHFFTQHNEAYNEYRDVIRASTRGENLDVALALRNRQLSERANVRNVLQSLDIAVGPIASEELAITMAGDLSTRNNDTVVREFFSSAQPFNDFVIASRQDARQDKIDREKLTGGKWLRVTKSELAVQAYVIYQMIGDGEKFCLEQSTGNRYRVSYYKKFPNGDCDLYLVQIGALPGEPIKPEEPVFPFRKNRTDPL